MAIKIFTPGRRFFASLFILAGLTGSVLSAYAENWQATLYEEGSPTRLVGVDKKKGNFLYFEKKSPLKARYSYPCVTGQLAGDKQQINDLRTPEGIYFVEYKIASGLDFREYGGIAYTLNYPNPVDRLRGKTGYGIWIHSKGFELVPTKGCVAIGLDNIREVGPNLLPGTPVVLAWELDSVPRKKNEIAQSLARKMKEWSGAWAQKSSRMFDYYDQEAYTKATENFASFRQNKERLFKILNFIKIFNREIHVLEGPGYWVTWAEQFYTASNLSTEGIRRLYWQKGDDGKFRIVGMEWTPRDVGMRADFMQGRLVAETALTSATDAASEKPVAPRLDMPELSEGVSSTPGSFALAAQPGPELPQNASKPGGALSNPNINHERPIKIEKTKPMLPARASVVELAKNLALPMSEPLVPKRPYEIDQPLEILWGTGNSIDAAPEKTENVEAQPSEPLQERMPITSLKVGKAENPGNQSAESFEKINEMARKATLLALDKWKRSFLARDAGLEKMYDRTLYNRIKKVPHGFSYGQAMIELRRQFAKPWLVVVDRPWQIDVQNDVVEATCDQLVASASGMEQGVRKLWWKDIGNGEWRIVASSFTPKNVGLYPVYLEKISNEIGATIENWRKSWQMAKVDEYMAHYAPNAIQQGRQGANAIRHQKEALWSRAKPANVQLSGLRLTLDKHGVRADMGQYFKDINGKSDKGIKTLLLRFDGNKWLITREDWIKSSQPVKVATQ